MCVCPIDMLLVSWPERRLGKLARAYHQAEGSWLSRDEISYKYLKKTTHGRPRDWSRLWYVVAQLASTVLSSVFIRQGRKRGRLGERGSKEFNWDCNGTNEA